MTSDDRLAPKRPDGLPDPLPGDARRSATPTIRGFVYQAWCSIDAWLQLRSADEIIYLEGAEDFDIVRYGEATSVQVRNTTASVSLSSEKSLSSLENFWQLASNEQRLVEMHYLTTSSVAMEIGGDFNGLGGIYAWRLAQTDHELAAKIAAFLVTKLPATSSLRAFLQKAVATEAQRQLFNRFHWFTTRPDIEGVRASVDNRIRVLLQQQAKTLTLATNVRNDLEDQFWRAIVEPSQSLRTLTRGSLLEIVERATTINLPFDQQVFSRLFGPTRVALLDVLLRSVPPPPSPLLQRASLTDRVKHSLQGGRSVLLTGTVYKGKTTLAQIVASDMCPSAWFVVLKDRDPKEIDAALSGLAERIDERFCPNLVIIDDLDLREVARRVYGNSLNLVLHRAEVQARSVLITAQGTSQVSAAYPVDAIEVTELSLAEVGQHATQYGCPEELKEIWSTLVLASTRGHPKLVQVRVAELANTKWPRPSPNDLLMRSEAETTARQLSRRLVGETLSPPIAEFLYTAAECTVPLRRDTAIVLAESVDDLRNAGDVVDRLVGTWLESVDETKLQATALLRGAGMDTWSPNNRRRAHLRLFDSIISQSPLSPEEAAALMLHAYTSGDPMRIANTAMRLQLALEGDAAERINGQLLWLTLVGLQPGEVASEDALACASVRSLQFRIASELDSNVLPQVCERWKESIERIVAEEPRMAMHTIATLTIAFSWSAKIPLGTRLKAIEQMVDLPAGDGELQDALARARAAFDDLPNNALPEQVALLNVSRCIDGEQSLRELLGWLDRTSTHLQTVFDEMLIWHLAQMSGAFVQGAWAAVHEQTKDWNSFLSLLHRVMDYARRRKSFNLAREAAKATSIILTEFQNLSDDALAVLESCDAEFGASFVTLEQRANHLFQVERYEEALQVWHDLVQKSVDAPPTSDPFAYRRAAICASRLGRWEEAAQICRDAVARLRDEEFEVTHFGLLVDRSFALSKFGDHVGAARTLGEAAILLSKIDAEADIERWDAVQRAAVEVVFIIERHLSRAASVVPRVQFGYASSPNARSSIVEPGFDGRRESTRVQLLRIGAILNSHPPTAQLMLESLTTSRYWLVRWEAVEAKIAAMIGKGAGKDFISAITQLELAIAQGGSKPMRFEADAPGTTHKGQIRLVPQRWFGLLVASMVCVGEALQHSLAQWNIEAASLLGADHQLTQLIGGLQHGAAIPPDELWTAVRDHDAEKTTRCGAAARLVLDPGCTAPQAFLAQCLLTSALSDDSSTRQILFNHHVARRFAERWRHEVRRPFQFIDPRRTLPQLQRVIESVDQGGATIGDVLNSVGPAISPQTRVSDFLGRIW